MKVTLEEIEKAADKMFPPLHPAWAGSENSAFQEGALWACEALGYNVESDPGIEPAKEEKE